MLTISSRAPSTILASLRFNGDGLCWADGFAQLARCLRKGEGRSGKQPGTVKRHLLLNLPMHLSSPVGYRRSACSPRKRGLRGPFSKGYMIVYGGRKKFSRTIHMPGDEWGVSMLCYDVNSTKSICHTPRRISVKKKS